MQINSQLRQVILKTKLKPTEYVYCAVMVLEMNSISLENVKTKQLQELALNFVIDGKASKISHKKLCKAILAYQYDDMITET